MSVNKSVKARAEAHDNSAFLTFTKPEAARAARCSVRFLEKEIRSGALRACKRGRRFVRIRQADLDAWLLKGATT